MENYNESWKQKAMENGWTPPEEPKEEPEGHGFRNFVIIILVVIAFSIYSQNSKNKPTKQLTTKTSETTAATSYKVLPGSAEEAVMNGELEIYDIKYRADAIGWSAAAWQKWYYIANQTGVKMESIEEAAKNLNEQLAAGDVEFLEALRELGITEAEAKAMKPEELFEKVMYGIMSIEN